MEEVDVGLPEKVIVYHTLKNLPRDYNTIIQVILNERRPPSYLELESRLVNEEMACKQDKSQESNTKALALTHRHNSQRSYNKAL